MKKRNRGYKIALIIIVSLALVILISVFGIIIYAKNSVDLDGDDRLFALSHSDNATTFYYDGSGGGGRDLEEYIPIELELISGASSIRRWVPLSEISENIKNAFIATEDRSFYQHSGVNLKRTALAAINQIIHYKSDFGGSTITQQLIKNLSGDNERTFKRKLNEIIRAYHLEYKHSKDEILELYLNIIPLGENAEGVGYASKVYFDKLPSELTIAEAATLVALANAPGRYNPYKNYDKCLEKRNVIISSMLECGYIKDEEYKNAVSSPIMLAERREINMDINSWFVETVCDELVEDLCEKYGYNSRAARLLILNGGLKIYTTVDKDAQELLEEYFENSNNLPSNAPRDIDFSMVVCDSECGDLRAIVGGALKKGGNRIKNNALALHPPGSTLKPLALYAPLINSGEITYSTVFDDVPVRFIKENEYSYREYPRNSPLVYDGLTPVCNALANSKNTIAIRLYDILGKDRIYSHLVNDFKFTSIVRHEKTSDGREVSDLSQAPLALGQLSYGISLRKLTEAYTVFPREGVFSQGRSYILCLDKEGNTLIEKQTSEKRVYSKAATRVMSAMLGRVVEIGTARSITLKSMVDVCGKTGTTSQNRDKLFIGYTPYYTAGIWCGGGDTKNVSIKGSAHLKIWDDIMHALHERLIGYRDIDKGFSTAGLSYLPFCMDSGKIPCDACLSDPRGDRIAYGYFIPGTEPSEICDRHILCDYDILNRGVYLIEREDSIIERVALLNIPERSFPKEIYVTDAEYVYRDIKNTEELPSSEYLPYFIYALPPGEYSGLTKGKRQFNCVNN